jgi:hypothetical protein
MAQRMSPNILEIRFSNTFIEQKTDFTHQCYLKIYERKIISRHFRYKSEYHIKNCIFMESVVFLLCSSSIISMLGGTFQEPWTEKVNLGFRQKKPQHWYKFVQNLSVCTRVLRKFSVL